MDTLSCPRFPQRFVVSRVSRAYGFTRRGAIHKWRQKRGGGRGLANFWPKEGRLREFGTDKGEGVQNPEYLADVMYVWPLAFLPSLTGCHHGHRRECFQNIRVPSHPLLRKPLQAEAAGQNRLILPRIFRRHAPHRSLGAVSCKSDQPTIPSIYSRFHL